ncbi:MAG TPA: Asp-tRNA(Asn)/Glu-tRNA(Gln) amidotransferase subunit GatB [Thermomicrobiales bacterium]|nr:Asp-tRNA(Asn)/Glu-tRNA(Gln) amidotransferase subunit GatB [Thermomicrobiales bacterium]
MAATGTELEFRTVIGLEVHAQVLTQSKMFCSCSAEYASATPNTHVCPVCMGLPGALPVINKAAIESVVRTGLALGCSIPGFCKLDRKNYFYPDLPKGYQISQYDLPLCLDGQLTFTSEGVEKTAGITRVHIEEDTGRLLHREEAGESLSLVDLNRSGVPLMEIVGEPDLTSPTEARDYLMALRQILRYIGASTGNMEEGAFRCDANISTRTTDGSIVGEKVEIKNMNSFRAVERALVYEEERQREVLSRGGSIPQETRGWVDAKGVTVSQRTKESAHDYRYFPEPDLPPLTIEATFVDSIRSNLQELPRARKARFIEQYRLGESEAEHLTLERETSEYFEAAASAANPAQAKQISNWLLNDVFGLQRERGLRFDQFPIEAAQLTGLVDLVENGVLTGRGAKDLLTGMHPGEDVRAAAERLDLISVGDADVIRTAAIETIEANPAAVADYKNGKKAAIGRLMGETIRATGGRGRPEIVRAVLEELLSE